MNRLSGRVVLKETGIGIPDLQVVAYDADPGTVAQDDGRATGPNPARAALDTAIGDRIGSRLTGVGGAFSFEYDDVEVQLRNPAEQRPDLMLSVLAPEEPDLDEAKRTLYTSARICRDAGRTEQVLIRLPSDVLTKAGISLPVDPGVAQQNSTATRGKLKQAIDFQLDVEAETHKIASERVAAVRARDAETTSVVQAMVMVSLIGLSDEDAVALRIVKPGESAAPAVYDAINTVITDTINARPLVGYLVLTEEEAQPLRAGNGWRQNIPSEELDPILFRIDGDGQRPATIVRSDPVAAMRRAATDDPLGGEPPAPDGPDPDPTDDADTQQMELTDLPAFVGRVVEAMMPHGTSGNGRPSAQDVTSAVEGLQLRAGPADVPARHDFHQLQIAFDFVWQHAIDDGVIEATHLLTAALVQAGGDPAGAVRAASNPVAALRKEARQVAVAQATLQQAGVMARGMQPAAAGSGGPLDPGRFWIPRPPVIDPPFQPVNVQSFPVFTSTDDILGMLNDLLNEKYKFQVFAPHSVNFGLLVTYSQWWQRIRYQVGELVETLTLSPKEVRKVTSKQVVRTERSVKEMQENQRNRKDETSVTMRSEAEIVQKAQNKTNFNATAKGNYDIGISSGDATSSLTRDAEASSQETKKSFHEAVLKAAQEYRDEHKLEVETKTAGEMEFGASIELTNPNDELTVTYLFYELQQLFSVTEHIHKLTPMVMVAMEVPNPSRYAIDKILLSHQWIINRVLLDDRYRPALDYLCSSIVGDELALADLKQNVTDARKAVETLQKLHRDMEASLRAREAAYDAAVEARAGGTASEGGEGVVEKAWEGLFGSDDSEDLDALRIREDLRKDQYERSVREEKELRMRLDSEIASLTSAQEVFSKANAEHSNHLLQIGGLRTHFKENMLYYMQAIWSFTFKDQIFFELSSVKVPKVTQAQRTYDLFEPTTLPLSLSPKPGQVVLEVRVDVQLTGGLDPGTDFVTLAEVADLDSPMGFKGNYMLFPLKQSNPLTDYMMTPYLDTELGLHDPDELGSWSPEEFVEYAKALLHQQEPLLTTAEMQALRSQLTDQYRRIVSNPRPTNDEVVVPTNSLYIEALPGTHPLLEDFKLAHRAIDVDKARVEAAKLRLESLRYAGRLLDEEFEDPDIDRLIKVTGTTPSILVPPDA